MNRIALDFPLGLYAGVPLAVGVLALLGWSQRRGGVARLRAFCSLAFRGAALLLVVLLAARPVWIEGEDEPDQGNTVVLLADRSSSMSLEDGRTTRYRQVLDFARDRLLPALKSADLRARGFLFAEDAEEADGPQLAAAVPDGKCTNLSGAIARASARAERPPVAIVALTDGAANQHRDNARAVSALFQSRVPFVGIGFGSETEARRLLLRRLISPPTVHPNQEFHVSAQLEMSSPDEMPPFDLLLLRDARLLQKKTISAGKGQRTWLESFALTEEEQGAHTYTVQLVATGIEGLRCPDPTAVAHVRVAEGEKLRLLFAQGAPSWNYKFIRLALRSDPEINLTGLTRTSRQSVFRQDVERPGELAGGFPSTLNEIAPFRVVVLSGFTPADLTVAQQDLLKRFCGEFGGGVLMIGGAETFGPYWQDSPLEQLLPVRFAAPSSMGGRVRRFRLQLTEEALDHPVFEISDSGTQRGAWAGLPTFSGCARVETAKAGAQVWAVCPDDRGPNGRAGILMAQQRYGAGISAVICLRDLWRWRLANNSDPRQFDRFWQQLFRYLSEGGGQEVVIRFPDQDLRPKADVRTLIERRPDPQEPETPREYRLRIEDAENEHAQEQTVELAPAKSAEVKFQAPEAGVYSVTVLDVNRIPLASRTVEIRDANIEFQRAARDMDNLRQWAGLSGGICVKAEDCHDPTRLVAQIKARTEHPARRRQGRLPLGVNHWVLAILLACLCAEWALRKQWGLP